MHVRYFTPSPALRPYIRSYYLLEGEFGGRTSDVFFADGCPELVFNVGVDFYRDGEREAWAKVIGQITQPLRVTASGRGTSFGIWFQPQGLAAFTGLAASEFTDVAVAADEIFGASLGETIGEGLAAKRGVAVVSQVDGLLEIRLRNRNPGKGNALVSFAVRRLIENHASERIDAVAEACNVSPRHLQQLFSDQVGLRPKQFQRIARFQAAMDTLSDTNRTSLTDVAYRAGYFDQAHFIRDFKQFTGVTPSRYHVDDHPIGRHF